MVTPRLKAQALILRQRNPTQSTDFSLTRFLGPHLAPYQGWAIFMDCDTLSRGDIAQLWAQRDESFALLCM